MSRQTSVLQTPFSAHKTKRLFDKIKCNLHKKTIDTRITTMLISVLDLPINNQTYAFFPDAVPHPRLKPGRGAIPVRVESDAHSSGICATPENQPRIATWQDCCINKARFKF